MFKSLERTPTLTERIEQQIEELITSQSLSSGQRLPPQDELAEQLGVSRTVIREATRFLMAKGLLEARKGSGVYVRTLGSGLSPGRTHLPRESGQPDGEVMYEAPEPRAPGPEGGLAEPAPAIETGTSGPSISSLQDRVGKGARMLPEERRRRILEMLDRAERITVLDLVERFGISRVTARADLDSLATEGVLVRSHGGALKPMDPRSDYPIELKLTLHHAEKVRIAAAAAKLIRDGDTIVFDSGTTTCEVAKQIQRLNFRSLTVITNALNIANELCHLPWVSLIMTGGMLRHKSSSFVGPQAHETLRDLNADHLFLGADAIDVEAGLTTPDILGAQVALRMIELAHEVTVVADASKFGRHNLTLSGKIEDVDRLITDNRISPGLAEVLRQRGIEVVIV